MYLCIINKEGFTLFGTPRGCISGEFERQSLSIIKKK
jgi:hypothetical protein